MSAPLNLTATGNFGPANGSRLGTVTLVGGSASATAVIREGGSGGTIVKQLATLTSTSAIEPPTSCEGQSITGQGHVTLTGTGASVNIELL